jgi:hypothetical protein
MNRLKYFYDKNIIVMKSRIEKMIIQTISELENIEGKLRYEKEYYDY